MNLNPIELILGLLVAVAALAWLASRVRVPYPIFLTLAGLAISFIPRLPEVKLQPDHVFLIFLPPLLYYSGLLTSWRDFRTNLRTISALAIGLVLFTTVVIAAVAHYYVGLSWPAAFVLGAIVSPPDAVAATAITQRLRVPKRLVTILEGESLVNDAAALIAYRVAVAAVVTGGFSMIDASWRFVLAAAGGIAIGYAVGFVMVWLRPRLRDSSVEGITALLVPYLAYLPAEWLHLSGVLSVVTAGVYVGRRVPLIPSSSTRLRFYSVWDTLVFLLNGLVFILIGLQLPVVFRALGEYTWQALAGYAFVLSGAVILSRMLWVYPAAYLPRLIPSVRNSWPAPRGRELFLISWTGLRGIVSLAAALALPLAAEHQHRWHDERNLILFLTFGVILATLVGQGLTLPMVIRALRLKGDDVEEKEEELARLEMTNAALIRLQVLAVTNEESADMIEQVRKPYELRLRYYGTRRRGIVDADGEVICRTSDEVVRVAIAAEREMLVKLRDEGLIGDDVLRKLQTELDLQEARLSVAEEETSRAPA